jgi:hypothetical protein
MPQKIIYPLPSYPQVMVITKAPPGVPQGPSTNLNGLFCSYARAVAITNMLMPEWGTNLVPVVSEESGGDYSETLDETAPNYADLVAQQYARWYVPGVGNAQQLIADAEQNGVGSPGYFVPANAIATTTATGPVWLSQWNPQSQCSMVQAPDSQLAALKAIVAIDEALIAALEKAA